MRRGKMGLRSEPMYPFPPEAALRFILIDKLLELEPGKRAVASAIFPRAHEIFADHFPGHPIVPGVLLTEAMGQTAGWLIAATVGFDRWPLLVIIEHAKFRRLVGPDEEVRVTAQVRSTHDERFAVDADVTSRGDRVATARLIFHSFAFALPEQQHEAFLAWAQQTFTDLGGDALLTR